MKSKGEKNQLPQREAGQFRSIVKFYETKQYKKGIKASDSILKKFPDHGETLSMKGLTLNCLGRKEEAYDLVKKGLKNDLGSHVCWHVFGLLYRSDRNYLEAIKCYRNALRIDKENLQILRDLSLLQIQMRDRPGFCETRRQLLTLKPNNRNNWVTFAIANHLHSQHKTAVEIIDAFQKTLEADRTSNYEDSEMMLYKNQMLEESGEFEAAIKHLDECRPMVKDLLWWRTCRGRILLKLERWEDAEVQFKELLAINPENYFYHVGVQSAVLRTAEHLGLKGLDLPVSVADLSAAQVADMTKLYAELQAGDPKAFAHKRAQLFFLRGAAFRDALDAYLRNGLSRGVPSLGADVKQLYRRGEQAKLDTLLELVTGYVNALRETHRFPGADADAGRQPPTALLWAMALHAQHHDRVGNYAEALSLIEQCLAHTPTAIDMYQLKGKFLKHAGDDLAAAAVLEQGRKLDLADRYINNKSCKFALRADLVTQANDTVALFTRHEGDQDAQSNLFDMQCMWYELEAGASYARTKDYGNALKKFLAVEKHFTDFQEDQFDFHTYCVRKMTLRAYVQMLRLEDRLHSHRYYTKAAAAAVRCYLEVHDRPSEQASEASAPDLSKLSPAEAKKAKLKAKREAAKKRKEDFQKAQAGSKRKDEGGEKGKKGGGKGKDKDDDPDGAKLLEKDPLLEAWRVEKTLLLNNAEDAMTHVLCYDVAFRRKKYLQALRGLKMAAAVSPGCPELHKRVVAFFTFTGTLKAAKEGKEAKDGELDSKVLAVIKAGEVDLLGGQSLLAFVMAYTAAHAGNVPLRLAAAMAWVSVAAGDKAAAVAHATELGGAVGAKTLANCTAVHETLAGDGALGDAAAAEAYKSKCAALFPLSTYFGSGCGAFTPKAAPDADAGGASAE